MNEKNKTNVMMIITLSIILFITLLLSFINMNVAVMYIYSVFPSCILLVIMTFYILFKMFYVTKEEIEDEEFRE